MTQHEQYLLAACDRLLATEREVLEMPLEQVQWFFGKPGHTDCFLVARALKGLIEGAELKRLTEGDK